MKKNFIIIGRNYYACKCLYQKYINGFYVPCGKCEFCRKSRAREWAFRLEQETKEKYSYNVLLTYNDEKLYYKNGKPSLNKVHITQFLKRFRYYVDEIFGGRLRFFLAGEYGGNFHRPHYHMILLSENNLEVQDSINGSFAFIHNILESCWGKGFCNIEYLQNSSASVRYLVQYLDCYVPKDLEDVDKPFRMMTRGNRNTRGLGFDYLVNNVDKVKQMIANINYTYKVYSEKMGKYVDIPIPRYYKRIIAPEEHKIKMADDFFYYCQEYYNYIKKLTPDEQYKFSQNRKFERDEQHRREREEYRTKKVAKRNRSAARLFTS